MGCLGVRVVRRGFKARVRGFLRWVSGSGVCGRYLDPNSSINCDLGPGDRAPRRLWPALDGTHETRGEKAGRGGFGAQDRDSHSCSIWGSEGIASDGNRDPCGRFMSVTHVTDALEV